MKKKLLSLFLIFVLVFSILPNTLALDEPEDTDVVTDPVVSTEENDTPAEPPVETETGDDDITPSEGADSEPEEEPAEDLTEEPAPAEQPSDPVIEEEPAPAEPEQPAEPAPEQEEGSLPSTDPAPEKEPVEPSPAVEQPTEQDSMPVDSVDTDVTITSEDGTVSVKGSLPENTTVSASPVIIANYRRVQKFARTTADDSGLNLNRKESKDFAAVYDIKLLDADGAAIQPNGAVTVRIENVPVEGPSATIYHILENADSILNGIESGTVYEVTSGALFRYANDQAFAAAKEATDKDQVIYVEVLTGTVENGSVSFDASSFSVYAVEGENNRLVVRFHQANSTETIDILVKKNDDLSIILYDPGVGTLQGAQLFKGWSVNGTYQGKTYVGSDYDEQSPAMTIETLREYVATLLPPATDLTVIEVWPVILKGFNVTYKDEQGVTIETISILIKDADSAEYTIDKTYIPMLQDEAFMGWNVDPSTQGNVTAARFGETTYSSPFTGPYENGTVLTINGSIILNVNVPKGYWLVFRENGKGAKYTSPQFIKTGDTTVRPEDPTRFGYDFVDWYEAEVDGEGNPLTDGDGNIILKSSPFTFNTTIDKRTVVYAKWEPVSTAKYTVIIWKQSVSDSKNAADSEKHYDFAESITIEGSVGTYIDSVSATGTGNNRYARVNGSNKRYEGFHLNRFDQNVTIVPEGTSVLNIYYDRNLVTLTFQVYKNSGGVYSVTQNTTGTIYGKNEATGEYFPIFSDDGGQTWYSSENSEFEVTEELTSPLYALVNGEYVSLSYDSAIGWYYEDHNSFAANTLGDGKYGLIDGEYILLTYRNGKYYYVSGTEIQHVPTTSTYGTQYIEVNGQYIQVFRYSGTYFYYYTYTPSTATSNNMYGYINGEYVEIERHGGMGNRYYTYNGEIYSGTRYIRDTEYGRWDSVTHYVLSEVEIESEYTDTLYTHNIPYNGPYYKRVTEPYTGTRYVYSGSSGWDTVHQYTGLYGSTLESNGYSWPTDYWWYDGYDYSYTYGLYGTGTRTTFLDAFILSDGGSEETFYGFAGQGTNTIRFYKQNADGSSYPTTPTNTVTASGGTFYISDKYNGFKAASYSTNGSTWTPLGDKNEQGYYASVSNFTNLYIRFERVKYNMQFMDGVYVDGNGIPLTSYTSRGQLKVVNDILYGSSLTSYNKGNANYYEPTFDGFVFEGWYLDDHCLQPYTFTTMPEGVTVYAKWRQIQYRVFLHPNVIESEDPSLDMGDQATSFRIAYGEMIDSIKAYRDEYELIGWYTDPGLTQAFNFDSYVLNDDTVKTPYNQTEDTELTTPYATVEEGKEGINSDAIGYNGGSRFWITRKLDLYAKWRSILVGALGINVVYESGEDGDFADGTDIYNDVMLYKDLATAYGAAASVATDSQHMQFKYWDLQKYENGEFVSSDEKVYPGDTFVVRKAYSQQTANPDNTPENPSYTYTVKLVAVYGPIETPSETTVRFDPNLGAFADVPGYVQTTYSVNETITFPGNPQREHYTFVGWAGSPDATMPDISIADMQSKVYAADNLEGLAWFIHDDTLNKDINVLYAVWEEELATINYIVVGPVGVDSSEVGTVTLNKTGAEPAVTTSEEIGVETGVPVGATAVAVDTSTYRFVGWFDNAACEGEPLSTNPSFVPSKESGELWANPTNYYAKFEYNLTKLKITKTGMEVGENAVFTVTGKGIENGITVVVKNGETVTIDGVYVGEIYTITEVGGWTWKYTANATSVSKTIEAPPAENLVTFTNTLNNNHWLSGENRKTNVFKKATTTPAAG